MTIGNRIAELRKAKGFTQEYVADQLGVSRQAVSKWEQDQTSPDTKNLIALAQLLDTDISFLAMGTSSRTSSKMDERMFRATIDTKTTTGYILLVMGIIFLLLIPFLGIVLLIIAIVVGIAVDLLHEITHKKHCDRHDHSECSVAGDCSEGYAIHTDKCCSPGDTDRHHSESHGGRHFGWKRISMLIGLGVFIVALASGKLGHDHGAHEAEAHAHSEHVHSEACTHEYHHGHEHYAEAHADEEGTFHIDLLNEDWMNILFAGLSVIMLFVLVFSSDHFVEGHLWNHIVKKHLPTIFAWTFGVLLVLGIALQHIDINRWISDNTALMILLATVIGIIPESGPHMIFVTLFATGVVPFPVLLASSISQDGHASIPLLAESKKSFFWAKLINCAAALAVGYGAMLFC